MLYFDLKYLFTITCPITSKLTLCFLFHFIFQVTEGKILEKVIALLLLGKHGWGG